nr:hypothetical protein CFP56_28244 [Quercus suber]
MRSWGGEQPRSQNRDLDGCTPTKKKTTAKKSDKRMKMDPNLFRSIQHFERYRDSFSKGTIIQERFVDFRELKDTFIPECFEGREEFYANVVIREDELSCWVRRKQFTLDAHDIDKVLGLEGLEDYEFTNYNDRMLSLDTVQKRIGGVIEKKCLNTSDFPKDMRCLTIIMMYNLYPIRKMTTLTNAKAIFLMELKEKTFIDISSHIFDIIMDETRSTPRPKLIFPSLFIRIFREKGVAISQDISPLPPLSTINKFTLTRIQRHLPGEEVEDVQEERDPMETETEAADQSVTSKSRRKRSRSSTSSAVPPNAFQIILERLDTLREVQTQHTERMIIMQDQIDVLSAKIDSISTNQEQ